MGRLMGARVRKTRLKGGGGRVGSRRWWWVGEKRGEFVGYEERDEMGN